MKSVNAKARQRGFTLAELLVVIAIIGLLITLLLPAVQAAENEKNETYFKQTESTLNAKGLAAEILIRHQEFVRAYETRYQTLLANSKASKQRTKK